MSADESLVTALAEVLAELEEKATHDPLTGLGNRALLTEHLRRLQGRTGWCVQLIDLDGFKAVNDTYGHAAGDEVLRVVAARLTHAVRPGDVVVRYGGDEFVVVSNRLDVTRAIPMGERIVAALSAPMHIDGGSITVGASVGMALVNASEVGSERVLAAADAAMYQAKREGKGTVRWAVVASESANAA